MQLNSNQRNSNHELLRIFSMCIIVFWHLISCCIYSIPHEPLYDKMYEAFFPTVHIGVILFVLISGYYTIKPSIRGVFKLLFVVLIYYLPIEIIRCIHENRYIVDTLMFITNTPYWFIRTYLYLYIITPLLNRFIETTSLKSVTLLLIAFAIISLYFGSTHGDNSLIDGKNLVNFIFLYYSGYLLHCYQEKWEKISWFCLIMFFVLLNLMVVYSLLIYEKDTVIGDYIWRLSFPYCSPILLLNAVLVFMIFSKLNIHSTFVNVCASSMFSVYIIHAHPAFYKYVIIPLCEKIMNISGGVHQHLKYICILLVSTFCIMIVCV